LNPSKYDFDPLYHKAENFCPVVPEICRVQVHVPRKEREEEEENNNNNNKKRSKNNKSPNVIIESYGKVEISYINVDNF
jgi:hypothetical protein